MFIAEDIASFRSLFLKKLDEMLDADELGAFILVLANSMQDDVAHGALASKLKHVYERHLGTLKDGTIDAAPDDLHVFEQLAETGIDGYSIWESSIKQGWIQLYNPIRSLRPPRASGKAVDGLLTAFDPDGFHFNKPFLKPEVLWEGDASRVKHGSTLTVLYNKFPFMPYHLLLVFDAASCNPQYLTEEYHHAVWRLGLTTQQAYPGLGIGYNSVGACASVNHLHFQGFIYDALPVESDRWQHNGGDEVYPMQCRKFDDADGCWAFISTLHEKERAYNLLYRPGECYVLLRKTQGDPRVSERMMGSGWIEGCGLFSEKSRWAFDELSADDLTGDVRSLSLEV